jgi:hypothetical protein
MSVPASELRTSRPERQSEGSPTGALYDGVTRDAEGPDRAILRGDDSLARDLASGRKRILRGAC